MVVEMRSMTAHKAADYDAQVPSLHLLVQQPYHQRHLYLQSVNAMRYVYKQRLAVLTMHHTACWVS